MHGVECNDDRCTRSSVPRDPLTLFFELSCEALSGLGVVNARCAGAVGDGNSDDTDVLERLLERGGRSKTVLLPPGTYNVSRPLRLKGKRTLMGAGAGTVIRVADEVQRPIPAVVRSQGPNEVLDVTIDGNARARIGLHLHKTHGVGGYVRGVVVRNALSHGFLCDYSMASMIERVSAHDNGGDGFRFNSCNAELVFGLVSRANRGHGVHVTGGPSTLGVAASGGVHLLGGRIVANRLSGARIEGTSSFSVLEDFDIESRADGVEVAGDTQLFVIRRNRLAHAVGQSALESRAVRIQGASYNGFVAENVLVANEPKSQFARIELGDDVSHSHVIGNAVEESGQLRAAPVDYEDRNVVIFSSYEAFLESPWSSVGSSNAALGFGRAPPTASSWVSGDVVLSTRATPELLGWICQEASGPKCRWKPLAAREFPLVGFAPARFGLPTHEEWRPIPPWAPRVATEGERPPSSVSKGCQAQLARGVANVKCFGALGDGATDDTQAFRRAISSRARYVYLPPGEYTVSQTLDVSGVVLFGAGLSSRIRAAGTANGPVAAVLSADTGPTRIERIAVHAARQALRGISVTYAGSETTLLRRVVVGGAAETALHLAGVVASIESVGAFKSGRGVYIDSPRKVGVLGLQSSHNSGGAMVVLGTRDSDPSARGSDAAARLVHLVLEQNGGTPLTLSGLRAHIETEYAWIENAGGSVRVDAVDDATLRYVRAVGRAGDHRAFWIGAGSSGVLLEASAANHARGKSSDRDYARANSVFVEPGCGYNRLVGNMLDSERVRLPLSVDAEDRTTRTMGTVGYRGGARSPGLLTYRSSPPAQPGRWQQGDLILSSDPHRGGAQGWLCLQSSRQGTCQWTPVGDGSSGK